MMTDEEAKEFFEAWGELRRTAKKANLHWKILAIWSFFLGLGIGHYFDDWLLFLWN